MLPTLERLLENVESLLDENLSMDDVCLLWLDLIQFQQHLDVIMRSVEEEATEKLHEHFGDDASGKPITGKRTMYETPAGPVHLELAPNRRRAWGSRVVDQLAAPMITSEGELVDAVPAAVLREVLPAAAAEGETSGGWRWAPLRKVLGDEMYDILVTEQSIEERLPVLRRGEVWRP